MPVTDGLLHLLPGLGPEYRDDVQILRTWWVALGKKIEINPLIQNNQYSPETAIF